MCLVELYGLSAIEANKYPLGVIVIMISHRGVHVSFKTPHDKADIVCLQDM
jgi:hypothetical protein